MDIEIKSQRVKFSTNFLEVNVFFPMAIYCVITAEH